MHVSGTISSDNTTFGGSLDLSYDTSDLASVGHVPGSGAGAKITADVQPVQIEVAGANKTGLAITGSVLIGSGANGSLPSHPGNDTNFFVSGSIGSKGSSIAGTSAFGGDLFVSGALGVNTVTVTSDGKVGIGMTNPSYKLSVGGNAEFGEYLYHRGDADTYIQLTDDKMRLAAGNEVMITADSTDSQKILKFGDGGDIDHQFRTNGDDNTLFVQGSSDRVGMGTNAPSSILHIKESAPTVTIQRESNTNNSTLQFMGQAGATATVLHMGTTNDLVMTTFDGVDQEEILRLGSHYAADVRQVILLSGSAMHAGAMQPKQSADINFFASGSAGSRGTTTRGTALFGGDLVSSGTIVKLDSADGSLVAELANPGLILGQAKVAEFGTPGSNITSDASNNLYVSGANELRLHGNDYIILSALDSQFRYHKGNEEFFRIKRSSGDAVLQPRESNKDIVFQEDGGTEIARFDSDQEALAIGTNKKVTFDGTSSQSEFVSGDGTNIQIGSSNRVLIMSGGAATSSNSSVYTDTNFFVSGSIGSKGTTTKGTSTFGGDLVVSGASSLEGDVTLGDAASLIVPIAIKHKSDLNTNITFNNDRIRLIANNATNLDISSTQVLFIPGTESTSSESSGADVSFYISGSTNSRRTAVRGTTLIGGDLVVSGAIRSSREIKLFNNQITVQTSEQFWSPFRNGMDGDVTTALDNAAVPFSFSPYSGSLDKILVCSRQASMGGVTLALYKNGVIHGHMTASMNGSATSTPLGNLRKGTFDFNGNSSLAVTGSNIFDPNDLITLSIKRTGGTNGDCSITAVFSLDTTVDGPDIIIP